MAEITTAHLTVDVVILAVAEHHGLQVLLVERDWPPYQGCWALPGGYVDEGEPFEVAACREVREETGLDIDHVDRVDVYGAPDRDPRGRVISVAHVILLPTMQQAVAGDDARDARWMSVADVLATPNSVAFDHHEILRDAVARVAI